MYILNYVDELYHFIIIIRFNDVMVKLQLDIFKIVRLSFNTVISLTDIAWKCTWYISKTLLSSKNLSVISPLDFMLCKIKQVNFFVPPAILLDSNYLFSKFKCKVKKYDKRINIIF